MRAIFQVITLTKNFFFFGINFVFHTWHERVLANWNHLWTESIQNTSLSALLVVFFPVQVHACHVSLFLPPSHRAHRQSSWGINASLQSGARDRNEWQGFCHLSKFIFYNCSSGTQGRRVLGGPSHLSRVRRWGSPHPGPVATIHPNAARQTTICSHFPTLELEASSLGITCIPFKTWKGAGTGRELTLPRWGNTVPNVR